MPKSLQTVKAAAFLGAILLLLQIQTGHAQPPQGRGFMPDSAQIAAMVDTMSIKMSFSQEQKEKFRKIYFASFEENRTAFEKNRGDFQAMREARMQITEKRDNEVRALLTEEQKKIYEKILQEQREQMQKRMGERRWRN